MRSSRILAIVTAALSYALPVHAAGKCDLVEMASLDMGTDDGGRITVPMTVSGRTLNMVVDTGGVSTMLTDDTVNALGLNKLEMNKESELHGFGGERMKYYTVGRDVSLGGMKASSMPFIVTSRAQLASDEQGVLAPDVLRRYDADFDFANARFNLFSRDHCPGHVVYWTHDPYAEIDISSDEAGHIVVPITIDGHQFMGLIDTGASNTVMNWAVARSAFGLDENSKGFVTRSPSEAARSYRYRFGTLTLQGVTVNDPVVSLYPDEVAKMWSMREVQLILGIETLRKLHLYVSYGERKLYVTPASAH